MVFYKESDGRPFWLAYECVNPRPTEEQQGAGAKKQTAKVQPQPRARANVFMPTCVCLVSRVPYMSAFTNCLRALLPLLQAPAADIRDILSTSMASLAKVPVPPAGRLALQFQLNDRPILCEPPPHIDLPASDTPLRFVGSSSRGARGLSSISTRLTFSSNISILISVSLIIPPPPTPSLPHSLSKTKECCFACCRRHMCWC